MAIPKDPYDQQMTDAENSAPDLLTELSPGADLPEAEPVQVAAANIVTKATRGVFGPGPSRADVINKPTAPWCIC